MSADDSKSIKYYSASIKLMVDDPRYHYTKCTRKYRSLERLAEKQTCFVMV